MIQSMTGFGSANRGLYKVDIRSLNSKYMDINCRISHNLLHLEMNIRKLIRERFSRGKFDVYIKETREEFQSMRLDEDILPTIESSISTLKERIGYSGEISLDTLLRFKDVLFVYEHISSEEDILIAVDEALDNLQDMRYKEGENIVENLLVSLQKITDLVNVIDSKSERTVEECRKKLISRLKETLNEVEVDEFRLYQEVILISQKADIKEEINRLKSHIKQFGYSLDNETVGKKLDFLTQEMYRETNTISQKSDDIDIINCTIDLKTEIDRIKEQVQNIQ